MRLRSGVGGDQPNRNALGDGTQRPAVKAESLTLQGSDRGFRKGHEYLIGIHRLQQRGSGDAPQPLGQSRRHRIRMAGIRQPQSMLEIGDELRADEPQLGPQMSRLFAPALKIPCPMPIEKDHGLGA
jgi:hypothetical protein